jgi:hypothetical protein
MNAVRLVIRDGSRDIHGTPHGDQADRVVAALSAEPETIEELDVAIERFHAPQSGGFFSDFSRGINDEPCDSEIVIVDLAARLIAYESDYLELMKEGCVGYHDADRATEHGLRFHLPRDWEITESVEGWKSRAADRRRERAANPPLDVRAVVYGRPLLKFLAAACFNAPRPVPRAAAVQPDETAAPEDAEGKLDGDWPYEPRDEVEYDIIRDIHARWMMTPRDDLRGRTPREVMLEKRDFIGWDMQDRCERWSKLDAPARGLDQTSHAWRYAGFGTHELVVYYELVRKLLWDCRERLRDSLADRAEGGTREYETVGDFLAIEVPLLEQAREEWLDSPDPEYSGRTPREVIEHERARIPEAMSGHDAMIDDDCPLCQMMGDMPGPVFWGLDGCNMDDDFAFEMYRTREEWEQEQCDRTEWNRKFNAEREEIKRLGVENPEKGYSSPDYVWQRSFVSSSAPDFPAMRVFAIGSNLAELIVDVKEPTEDRRLIDQLSRDFGNLREIAGSAEFGGALLEPVIDRFCETLEAVAATREDLREKCDDLAARVRRFAEPPTEEDTEPEVFDDDDVPF